MPKRQCRPKAPAKKVTRQSSPSEPDSPPIAVIFGGGHGGHVCAALLAGRRPDVQVRVLTRTADQWNEGLQASEQGIKCFDVQDNVTTYGKPVLVGSDPSVVLPGARYMIFVSYQNDHEKFLETARPYITPGCVIGALNCGCGFKCMCKHILGADLFSQVTLFATSTLPWACRVNRPGNDVTLFGKKDYVVCSVSPRIEEEKVVTFLNSFMLSHPRLEMNNFLALEFMNPGSQLHPVIFRTVDRVHNSTKPWAQPPLFYLNLDDQGARELATLSNEYQVLKCHLLERYQINLTSFLHIKDWVLRSYENDIADKSTLKTMIHTVRPYKTAILPCIAQPDGTWLPDYQNRYISEEVPCGNMVIKGLAVMAGIITPMLDEIIQWGQAQVGKEYLVDGQLTGRDLATSRAPQRFGVNTLDEFMAIYQDQ